MDKIEQRIIEIIDAHADELQAMAEDFSWARAAERYVEIYSKLHPEVELPKKKTKE